METFMMLAFIAAVTFIGWNILYLISARAEGICLLERLFISYGMGMGFVSMGMLFFYFLGGEFSASRILSPWLLLIALNIVFILESRLSIRWRASASKVLGRLGDPNSNSPW